MTSPTPRRRNKLTLELSVSEARTLIYALNNAIDWVESLADSYRVRGRGAEMKRAERRFLAQAKKYKKVQQILLELYRQESRA